MKTAADVTIKVVHCLRATKMGDDTKTLYCGRGKKPRNWMYHVQLGNPFTITEYGRGGCIAKYEDTLLSGGLPDHTRKIQRLAEQIANGNTDRVQLACYCAPRPCHCNVIKAQLEKAINEHAGS